MYATEPVKGVIAPLLTPFNDDLSVATDLYVSHAFRMMDEGCAGLAPFGTTGEALSVTREECVHTLWALKEAGIDPACMIPGTGLCSYGDTAELTHACLDLGCAGALVLPPYYYKNVTDQGIYDYYARLIEVGGDDLRLYLYNIPQMSGVRLSVPLVRKLHADFPKQIVGIKDSSGDWENAKELLKINGLIVYISSETAMPKAIPLGAQGCMTATANLNAQAIVEMQAAYNAGNAHDAAVLYESVTMIRDAVAQVGFIEVPKACLAVTSGDARWANVRPPHIRASAEAGRALRAAIADAR